MKLIILMGAPGSGKGTHAARIEKETGLRHLSTGEMLRKEINAGTKLGKEIEGTLRKGCLVPDELIVGIIDGCVRGKKCPQCPDKQGCEPGFILDGFPRTLIQGMELDRMLKEQNRKIDHVVLLDVEDSALFARIEKRISESGTSKRADDNEITLRKRLEVYTSQTKPLVPFYEKQGLLRRVDGMKPIEEVTQDILDVIGCQEAA